MHLARKDTHTHTHGLRLTKTEPKHRLSAWSGASVRKQKSALKLRAGRHPEHGGRDGSETKTCQAVWRQTSANITHTPTTGEYTQRGLG